MKNSEVISTFQYDRVPHGMVRRARVQDNRDVWRRKCEQHKLATALGDLIDATSEVNEHRRVRRWVRANAPEIVCLVILAITMATLWTWLAWASTQP